MKKIIYHLGLTQPPFYQKENIKVIHTPVIRVEYYHHHSVNDIKTALVANPIIILMSKSAVNGLYKWMLSYGIEKDFFKSYIFWSVGNNTKEYLQSKIGINSVCPKKTTNEGLLIKLTSENIRKIILIGNQSIQKVIKEKLCLINITCFHFIVYKNLLNIDLHLINNFDNNSSNYVVFTSPSTVKGFLENLSLDLSRSKIKIISIGPTTTKTIKKYGGTVYYESQFQDIKYLYNHVIEKINININQKKSFEFRNNSRPIEQ